MNGSTATAATSPQPSSKPRSTLRPRRPAECSETKPSSLHQTQGDSTTTTNLDWDTTKPNAQLVDLSTGTSSTNLIGNGETWAAFDKALTTTPLAVDAYRSTINSTGSGAVTRAAKYDPFGTPNGTSTFEPQLGYRGELHTDTLLYLRARDYQPTTGKFTTTDPVDGTDGTTTVANPYPYANNNPLNHTDPTGKYAIRDDTFAGGFVASPPQVNNGTGTGTGGLIAGLLADAATQALANQINGSAEQSRLRQLVLASQARGYDDFPRPQSGMIVYRVHNNGLRLPARLQFPPVPAARSPRIDGQSWSPVHPGLFRHDFFKRAGLPWQNWGIALTIGRIKPDTPPGAITPRPAKKIDDDIYDYHVPGGLIEWVVQQPVANYIQFLDTSGVAPGYGYVEQCKQVAGVC